jgi:sucrose-6-phosphate hydrolase SacC (GH32 family)
VKAREAKLLADKLDTFDLDFTVNVSKSTGFTLDLRGTKLTYDAAKGTLTCKGVTAPVKITDDLLDLKVLVDRGSVEVFAGSGRVAMSIAVIPDAKNDKLELLPTGGDLIIRVARVWRMKSAWGK